MIKTSLKAVNFIKNFKNLHNTDDFLQERAKNLIQEIFFKERGILMKIAQGAEDLNSTITKDYEKICFPLSKIKDHIFKVLDPSKIDSIEESQYPGSIAQVHRAKTTNGEIVAIKVKYPDIEKNLKEQLTLLKIGLSAGKLSPIGRWGIDFNGYSKMISSSIHDELSFDNEIHNMNRFISLNTPHLIIPKVYEDLCNNDVIVMSWIEGETIEDVIDHWTTTEKRNLAYKFTEMYLTTLLKDGFIQVDTNPGNFSFVKHPAGDISIIGHDYGNCLELTNEERGALLYLIHNIANEFDIDLISVFSDLSFNSEKLIHIEDQIHLLSKFLIEPFSTNFAYDLKGWDLKHKIDLCLGENKWWFRSSGSPRFMKITRSIYGILNIIQKMESPVFFKKIFDQIYKTTGAQYSPQLRDKSHIPKFSDMANFLNIVVCEDDREKVNIKLPASTIINLEEYIDSSVKEKLIKRDIHIEEIIKKAMKHSLRPQDIFFLEDKNKTYSVQLI